MKKSKNEGTKPIVPMSLTSKRMLSKHEQLFMPYKIEWKGNPLQPMQNNSSKSFFQSMKNELSVIKNDVQKLIKKETLQSEQSRIKNFNSDIKSSNYVHNKNNQKAFSQFDNKNDRIRKKMSTGLCQYNPVDITRKVSVPNTFDFRNIDLKNSKPKNKSEFDNQELKDQFIHVRNDFFPPTRTHSPNSNQNEPLGRQGRLEPDRSSKIQKLHSGRVQERGWKEIQQPLKLDRKQKTIENSLPESQLQLQRQQIESLRHKLMQAEQNIKIIRLQKQSQAQLNFQKQAEINGIKQRMKQKQQQVYRLNSENKQYQCRMEWCDNQINNLVHLNRQIQHQMECRNHEGMKLQHQNGEIRNKLEQMKNDLQKKIDFLQKEVKQYQNREDIFAKEIQMLSRENQKLRINFNQKPSSIQSGEQLSKFSIQNESLRKELKQLQLELYTKESQYNKLHEQLIAETQKNNLQSLGADFEKKMKDYLNETYSMKNKIEGLNALIQQRDTQIGFLREEVRLYEEREKMMTQNRPLKANEWEQMKDQVDRLTALNAQNTDKYELIILKLENQLAQKQANGVINNNPTEPSHLNQLVKEQIDQIDALRMEVKKLKESSLQTEREYSNCKILRQNLTSRLNALEELLAQKSNAMSQNMRDLLNSNGRLSKVVEKREKEVREREQLLKKLIWIKSEKGNCNKEAMRNILSQFAAIL